jgi:hypothetical protein
MDREAITEKDFLFHNEFTARRKFVNWPVYEIPKNTRSPIGSGLM